MRDLSLLTWKEIKEIHANDFHAGWIETSSLLAMNETYVRNSHKEVEDSDITDRDMISVKKQINTMGKY